MEFCTLEPFGPQMDDLRAGKMTAEICSRLSNIGFFGHVVASGKHLRQGPKPDSTKYTPQAFMPWLIVPDGEQRNSPSSLAIVPGAKPIAEKGIHTAAQWNTFKQGMIDTCAAVRSNQRKEI